MHEMMMGVERGADSSRRVMSGSVRGGGFLLLWNFLRV